MSQFNHRDGLSSRSGIPVKESLKRGIEEMTKQGFVVSGHAIEGDQMLIRIDDAKCHRRSLDDLGQKEKL